MNTNSEKLWNAIIKLGPNYRPFNIDNFGKLMVTSGLSFEETNNAIKDLTNENKILLKHDDLGSFKSIKVF